MKRRIVLLAERIDLKSHKTAYVLLGYLADEIVGIVDPYNRGKNLGEILGAEYNIPIASGLDELLEFKPNYLLVGFIPAGGLLKTDWYPIVIQALQSKINVISGLHQNLRAEAEFSLLAKKYKTKLIHLREQKETYLRPRTKKSRNFTSILALDTALSGWDIVTSMELFRNFKKKSFPVNWVATSILGNLIKKQDYVAESFSADQLSTFISDKVYSAGRDAAYVFVEGYASLTDFVTKGVAVSILTGAQPDGIILCHSIDTTVFSEISAKINKQREILDTLLADDQAAPVLGISLNTRILEDNEAKDTLSLLQSEFEVPVVDPARFGASTLIQQITALKPRQL